MSSSTNDPRSEEHEPGSSVIVEWGPAPRASVAFERFADGQAEPQRNFFRLGVAVLGLTLYLGLPIALLFWGVTALMGFAQS
jgi:hypothetical protein